MSMYSVFDVQHELLSVLIDILIVPPRPPVFIVVVDNRFEERGVHSYELHLCRVFVMFSLTVISMWCEQEPVLLISNRAYNLQFASIPIISSIAAMWRSVPMGLNSITVLDAMHFSTTTFELQP